MKDFEIVRKEVPKLDDPVFIEGLPGIGNVGRIAATYLVQLFKAEKLGDMLSTSFPHQVKALKDGTLRLMRNELFLSRSPRDILYLTGDMQPLPTDFHSHYAMAESIIELCEDLGVTLIVTIGGHTAEDDADEAAVLGAASSAKLSQHLGKLGIELLSDHSEIPIVGLSGLLPVLAAGRSLDAFCLLSRTSGDIRPDSEAAEAVLKMLGPLLGIEIDTTGVGEVAKSIEREMDSIIKRIERLERTKSPPIGSEGYIH